MVGNLVNAVWVNKRWLIIRWLRVANIQETVSSCIKSYGVKTSKRLTSVRKDFFFAVPYYTLLHRRDRLLSPFKIIPINLDFYLIFFFSWGLSRRRFIRRLKQKQMSFSWTTTVRYSQSTGAKSWRQLLTQRSQLLLQRLPPEGLRHLLCCVE